MHHTIYWLCIRGQTGQTEGYRSRGCLSAFECTSYYVTCEQCVTLW